MRTQLALSEGWYVRELEARPPDIAGLTTQGESPDESWLSATMPAQVHEILLACGRIPDPHVGTSAAESAWVGEKDWAYACRFTTPESIDAPVLLRFGGLDTLASAYLNSKPIGRFENMFRQENRVEVHLR